jgi:hypothetical protein
VVFSHHRITPTNNYDPNAYISLQQPIYAAIFASHEPEIKQLEKFSILPIPQLTVKKKIPYRVYPNLIAATTSNNNEIKQ